MAMKKSCLKRRSGPTKKVWFDEIQFREYPMILGDNPSTKEGIPVTIDWIPQKEVFFELEYFELYRVDRRSHKQLKLNPRRRAQLALIGGCKLQEIGEVSVEVSRIQYERSQSLKKNHSHWTMLKDTIGEKLLRHKMKMETFTKVLPTEEPLVRNSCAVRAA